MVDKNELEKLLEEARIEERENMDLIKNFIESKTDKKILVRTGIYGREISVNVEFVDDNDKTVFGADFDIYYRSYHRDETPELQMSCGTIGSYTRREAPYQIDRMRLMLAIWDSEAQLIELFNSLKTTARSAADELQHKFEREQREIKEAEEKARLAEIAKTVVVGAEFKETDTHRNEDYTFTVSKITPKRVYFNYCYTAPDWNWCYEENKVIGRGEGFSTTHKTAYANFETLVDVLSRKGQKYAPEIRDIIHGDNYESRDFTMTKFIPEQ